MVDLEPEDYTEILNWFTLAHGRKDITSVHGLPEKALRVFWKLSFLAEDKLKEYSDEEKKTIN